MKKVALTLAGALAGSALALAGCSPRHSEHAPSLFSWGHSSSRPSWPLPWATLSKGSEDFFFPLTPPRRTSAHPHNHITLSQTLIPQGDPL